MFEKLAAALRGMGMLASTYIPAPMRDAFLEMARQSDNHTDELFELRQRVIELERFKKMMDGFQELAKQGVLKLGMDCEGALQIIDTRNEQV